jgi:hypothetical protein
MIPLLLVRAVLAEPIVVYDLETDDGGFIESGETGQWEWGVVRNGPGAGFDDAHAWSTGLARDYLNDTVDYLEFPLPDLSDADRPTLSFVHWFDIALGDVGWVEVDKGNGWELAAPLYGYPVASGFTGASGGWRTVVIDLRTLGAAPRVRLAFAADLSGVSAGWTIDDVGVYDGDVAAPALSGLTALADTEDLVGPYAVAVTAQDDTKVTGVTLVWTVAGVDTEADMVEVAPGTWRGQLPAQAPDTAVTYHVVATDGVNTSREPVESDLGFRVYLPAPTDVIGPDGRVVATSTHLSWTAPVSTHPVLGYEVLHDDGIVASTTDTAADVPIMGGSEDFAVRALYDAGGGDLSEPVTVDGVLPVLDALEPASAWPGDTVRVRLEGDYLLLVEGEVSLDLGDGVTVNSVTVRDVDDAYAELAIADDAVAGARTLTLESDDVELTLPDAFTVLAGADRPRLTGIDPDRVRQGDEGTLTLTAVGTLAATPTVDLGEGLVVESVESPGDGTVRVRYAVGADAPLGDHAVTLDDGVRVLEGVALTVRDALPPSSGTCGTPLVPAALSALLALGGALTRRRR